METRQNGRQKRSRNFYKIGKKLGSGEYGDVYDIVDQPDKAIKVLKDNNYLDDFQTEINLATQIGQLGVGPKIFDSGFFDETKTYFYVMEKLENIYLEKYKCKPPCRECQEKIIGVFEFLIIKGWIHHDNHRNNVGFSKSNAIRIFDFGFSKNYQIPLNLRAIVLAYYLYIFIEGELMDCDEEAIDKNLFYDVIYEIRRSEYEFGTYSVKYNIGTSQADLLCDCRK